MARHTWAARAAVMLLAVAAGAAAVPAAAAQSGLAGPVEGESIAQWTERWMDGPVGLIATREEREIFAELATTQERLQFIRLFWARRDPQVRGPRNEFLDEFAERLRYAEEHFDSSREPAWKTAFGQVVLLFGPPARTRRELSDIPGGFSDRPPILWGYDDRIEGIEPNEDLLFVYRAGRWKLMPPYSDTGVPEALKEAERNSVVGPAIPGDYQRGMDRVIQQSLAQPIDYRTAIDRVRTAVQLPDAQIPFGYEIEQVAVDGGKVRLDIGLTWRMDSLVFHLVDGEFRTDMLIDVQILHDGETIAAGSDPIAIAVPEADMEARRGEVVRHTLSVTVDRGDHELVMILMDQLLGYRTSYRDSIEVG